MVMPGGEYRYRPVGVQFGVDLGDTENLINEALRIGTVDSSNEELTRGLVEMRCNRCGLVDNLTPEQKRAIGESVLYSPYES